MPIVELLVAGKLVPNGNAPQFVGKAAPTEGPALTLLIPTVTTEGGHGMGAAGMSPEAGLF